MRLDPRRSIQHYCFGWFWLVVSGFGWFRLVKDEPLLFLIYINDLSDSLKSECKLLNDDTSLFSVVHDIYTSASDLSESLEKISN